MNTLDIVLLLLFIPGIIRGLSKGFMEQAISLVGIILSAWIAWKYYSAVGQLIAPVLKASETVLNIVSFVLLLIVVLLVLILLAKLLTKVVEMATLGWLNRVLGLVLSIFVTALILGLLATVFDALNERFQLVTDSKILADSVLYPLLQDFADFVFPFLKQIWAPVAEVAEEVISAV